MYHDGEFVGVHSSIKDTLAKLVAKIWWPTLARDVRSWVRSCSVCRLPEPQPGSTAEQRMELHGKFSPGLVMVAMGPTQPASEGNAYIFHAECPFSRWCSVTASKKDNAEKWARFLVEEVFFDVAGFPAVVRSDRGPAFISEVVRSVNVYLGFVQAFDSSYYPLSQGYLEARRKPINNVLAAYCRAIPQEWSRWIKLGQWAMRSTLPRRSRRTICVRYCLWTRSAGFH